MVRKKLVESFIAYSCMVIRYKRLDYALIVFGCSSVMSLESVFNRCFNHHHRQ